MSNLDDATRQKLVAIIEQLRLCNFETGDMMRGSLEHNRAFLDLCDMAGVEIPTEYGIVFERLKEDFDEANLECKRP